MQSKEEQAMAAINGFFCNLVAISNLNQTNSLVVERAFRSILTTARIVVEDKIRDVKNPPDYWNRFAVTLEIVLTHKGPDLIATASNALLMLFSKYLMQPRSEEAAFHLMYIASISEALSDKMALIDPAEKVERPESGYLH